MVATLCGATVLSLILLRKSAPRGKRSFILASILCLATLVGNVAGTQLSDRLSEQSVDIDADGRLNIYLLTLEAIGTAPWTGVGAGAYQDAIAAYKSDTFLHSIAVTKAHNTYLENALELGIPAALCLLAAITLLARETLTGIARRRRGIYLPATGTAASVLVGVHALVDFSLQIPAVTILYAVILGAAVAQSRPPRNESQLIRPSAPETPRAEAR
ncbi:MAG: O-antigen ligase family protein, partial [Marinomonas sp.]